MNKKGYTLVEVIVSVMILSIVGALLTASISTVIYFMSKSNSIKNASDEMFAYIEGSDASELLNSVNFLNNKTISYTINYSNGSNSKALKVNGQLSMFLSKQSGEITLGRIDVDGRTLLKDEYKYRDIIHLADDLYSNLNEAKTNYCKTKDCVGNGQMTILDDFLTEYYHGVYPTFHSEMIYDAYNNRTFYIVVYFPFDTKENGGAILSADPLIFLSEKGSNQTNGSENVRFVYDYVEHIWYFNANSNYTITFGKTPIEKGKTSLSVNPKYNGSSYVENFAQLKEQFKKSSYGWRKLDENAVYKKVNGINSYWKIVAE